MQPTSEDVVKLADIAFYRSVSELNPARTAHLPARTARRVIRDSSCPAAK